MKILQKICAFIMMSSICYIVAESFVIEKKEKKMSVADSKGECGQLLTQWLERSPDLLHTIAHAQSVAIGILATMFDNTYFEHMDKQSMLEHPKEYATFLDRQQQIDDLLQQQLDFLRKHRVQSTHKEIAKNKICQKERQ